jgi:hypothetical protein
MNRLIQWSLDLIDDRLQSGQDDRTLVGGLSVGLFAIGSYLLGGLPALVIGGVVFFLWIFGTPPLAIVIGSIGLTAITEPTTVSTVFGATPTMFLSPLLGVFCVGAGIAGLCLDPLVTAQQPTPVVVTAGLLVIGGGAGLLVAAHMVEVPIYSTIALAGVGVLFVAGVIARAVAVWTPSQEVSHE